jgi:hypothetical protein
MMLDELLSEIRTEYVETFRAVMSDESATGRVQVECEALNEAGQLVTEGKLKLPIRYDLAVFGGGSVRLVRVDSARRLMFAPVRLQRRDVPVTVESFQWDWCVIQLGSAKVALDTEPLRQWYLRWFAEREDSRGSALLEVVHFLSDPEESAGSMRLFADLGTAPTTAVVELLDACVAAGAETVTIGTLPNEPLNQTPGPSRG